jgi:uncharacterized protein YacL
MTATAVVARIVVSIAVLAIGATAARASSLSTVVGVAAGSAVMVLALMAESRAGRARLDRLVWGVVGGVVGLAAGAAIGVATGTLMSSAGPMVRAVASVLGLYLGVAVGVRRGPDLTGLNALLFPRSHADRVAKLVDTSAIVDGRIADLASTGFIDGPLVVPQFVLRELQQIADATDPRKRARGKRGFEVVQRLQRLPGALLEIDDVDVPGAIEVDRKLVDIAKARGARIITTDYNLNKLAELSGVVVLNVNELANALKPSVVAGEAMHVDVLREGKEAGQGVAYLDDGTMVVIDQGKRWIGQSVDVVVTSVLQTPAGRIIFTRRRDEEPARA